MIKNRMCNDYKIDDLIYDFVKYFIRGLKYLNLQPNSSPGDITSYVKFFQTVKFYTNLIV